MDRYTATEQAYKNGYEKGCADGKPKWIPLSEQKPDGDTLIIVFFEGMRDTPAAIQIMFGWCIGGSATTGCHYLNRQMGKNNG